MAELSTYLKVGSLAIVLEVLEAGGELPTSELEDPVRAIKAVSRDLTMNASLKLSDGRPTTAIAIQRSYLKAASDFYACHEVSVATKDVLVHWGAMLDRLERDPMLLVTELDWVAKRHMIMNYMERKGCGWTDPRVQLMDLQYHDVRPEKGLYFTLERSGMIERLIQDEEIARAELAPPTGTRAYFRG